MNQKEMERIAFLYLCGNRDRELLLEKEKMTFADFYGQIPDQKRKKVVEKWIQEKSA